MVLPTNELTFYRLSHITLSWSYVRTRFSAVMPSYLLILLMSLRSAALTAPYPLVTSCLLSANQSNGTTCRNHTGIRHLSSKTYRNTAPIFTHKKHGQSTQVSAWAVIMHHMTHTLHLLITTWHADCAVKVSCSVCSVWIYQYVREREQGDDVFSFFRSCCHALIICSFINTCVLYFSCGSSDRVLDKTVY